MNRTCFLCNKFLIEEQKFNISVILMQGTNLNIKQFLQEYVFHLEKVFISDNENICLLCFNLLKELENYILKSKRIQEEILLVFSNKLKISDNNTQSHHNIQELKEPAKEVLDSENFITNTINIPEIHSTNIFKCEHCEKTFTQKIGLQRHLPLHTGISRFKCNLCEKTFIHHSSFSSHKQSHLGSRDYKCEQCGKALVSKSHLKRHMKTHTREKRFECSRCPRQFAERYNLMKHVNHVHKTLIRNK